MKASINSNYNTYGTSRQNPSPCSYENGNYLDQTKTEFWTMDRPIIVNTNTTSRANTAGYLKTGGLSSWYATATYQVRPALYLKENIKIIGAGNINNPYQIKN